MSSHISLDGIRNNFQKLFKKCLCYLRQKQKIEKLLSNYLIFRQKISRVFLSVTLVKASFRMCAWLKVFNLQMYASNLSSCYNTFDAEDASLHFFPFFIVCYVLLVRCGLVPHPVYTLIYMCKQTEERERECELAALFLYPPASVKIRPKKKTFKRIEWLMMLWVLCTQGERKRI